MTDPAPLAVLLCSDAAEWITGQVYPVDGGYFPALVTPTSLGSSLAPVAGVSSCVW